MEGEDEIKRNTASHASRLFIFRFSRDLAPVLEKSKTNGIYEFLLEKYFKLFKEQGIFILQEGEKKWKDRMEKITREAKQEGVAPDKLATCKLLLREGKKTGSILREIKRLIKNAEKIFSIAFKDSSPKDFLKKLAKVLEEISALGFMSGLDLSLDKLFPLYQL